MLLFTPMSGRPPFSRLALLAAYAHLFSFISCFTLLVALRSTLHLQAVLTFTWIDCSHLPVGRQACTNPEHSPPQCRVSLLKAQGQSRTLFLPRHVQGFLVAYESARASLAGMQGPPAPTSFPFLPLLLQTISCLQEPRRDPSPRLTQSRFSISASPARPGMPPKFSPCTCCRETVLYWFLN